MNGRTVTALHTTVARTTTKKGLAVLLGLVLSVTLAGVSAPAAQAAGGAGGDWSSSFESGDPAPLVASPFSSSINVSAGSVMNQITEVEGSDRNTSNPSEDLPNIADRTASTKWFVSRAPSSAHPITATYTLAAASKVTGYHLTSGNDDPPRDPADWTMEGSHDGSAWQTLDSQSGQSWAAGDRNVTQAYSIADPGTYEFYRLSITDTADSSKGQFQLADWTLVTGDENDPQSAEPMITRVAGGPTGGTTSVSGAGFTGAQSLMYGGTVLADGPASSTNTLYEGLSVEIGPETELSYKVYPQSTGSALNWTSTNVAVDLQLSDGGGRTLMSDAPGLLDGYGFGVSASAQGAAKALVAGQWNSVHIDLSSLAGKTVRRVLLSFDDPSATGGSAFKGWVDDISVADAAPIDDSSLTNYVDTRRGSNANGSYSRGNTFPAVAVPNGFNFITPMTNVSSNTIYEFQKGNNHDNRPVLQGIGFTHMPSPWMGDSNRVSVMPSVAGGTPDANFAQRGVPFTHDHEVAQPDYYRVTLDDGVTIEATPTDHAGLFRFTFPEGSDARTVLLDRANTGQGQLTVAADGTVSGWVDSGNHNGSTRMFVAGSFDHAPQTVGTPDGGHGAGYASFDDSTTTVELSLATSFISADQAAHNLVLEVGTSDFDAIHTAATSTWNEALSVIDVPGATRHQKVSVYSSLYRMNIYPNSTFENVGTASSPEYQHASPVLGTQGAASATATNAQVKPGKMYVNNGFWDTYRTVWPLYSFLYPERAAELVDGFVQQYREGGWVARWSSPGYSDSMTGTSSDVAFADAYVDGSLPTDVALDAYDAALKNATVVSSDSATGRKGLSSSIFLGFTPSSEGESVSWGLEGNINDDGIAKMAAKLASDPATPAARVPALKDEAAYFANRASQYVDMFNPAVDFFTTREADGTFPQTPGDFDPTAWWGPYTETDAWNFAFHAPFDVRGLAGLYGGSSGLIDKLQQFYDTPEKGSGTIHEMAEARDVRMGQLGMSNQVSHHIPYIAAAAGDPALTQQVVRESLQRLFVGADIGQGYLGDEDNGEMSSWYLFSTMGFYPLALASGHYTIGSPQLGKIVVHRPDGDVTIRANNNSPENVYVQSVELNGQPWDSVDVPVTALHGGATLTFQMGDTPSSWGTQTFDDPAPSPDVDVTKPGQATVTSSDGADVTALTDDTSTTSVTFTDAQPSIEVEAQVGPVDLTRYTLTNAGSGATTPTAWTLQGSNDGQDWTTLDQRSGESFRWAQQTRPFSVTHPGSYRSYRLHVTATSDGAPPTLSELELYAHQAASEGPLTLTGAPEISVPVDTKLTSTLAWVSGGSANGSTATVDFGDGSAPVAAVVGAGSLGGHPVSATHTFTKTGLYSLQVTAQQGSASRSITVPVRVTRDATITGNFDNSCLSVVGIGANCDGNGYGFDASSLGEQAQGGFVRGTTITVPGHSDLSFALAHTADGAPDNVLAQGQRIRIQNGAGATQVSFIGTANERSISESATIAFADGATQQVPLAFGDWVGNSGVGDYNPPAYGGIRVAWSDGRTDGASGSDSKPAAIFATQPVDLEHADPVWVTLPTVDGTLKDGQLHVFAIATDGSAAAGPPLDATAATTPLGDATAGTRLTAELATVSGGDTALGATTATVNWGDGSSLTDGTVDGAAVSGQHTYATAGTYDVVVTVDDGVTTASASRTITVAPGAPQKTDVTLTRPARSAKKQLADAKKKDRIRLSTTVRGLTTGKVVFRDGDLVLGEGKIKGGKASTRLPRKAPVGKHHVTATVAATATTRAATSPRSTVVKVKKAALKKLKVKATKKVRKKGFVPHHKVKVKVKISKKLTNRRKPHGKVKVEVGKKKITKISAEKLRKHHRKVKVKVARRFVHGKKVKVKAVFKPKTPSMVKKKKAKTVVKVKK